MQTGLVGGTQLGFFKNKQSTAKKQTKREKIPAQIEDYLDPSRRSTLLTSQILTTLSCRGC